MSEAKWVSPVQISDSSVLGLGFDVADSYGGEPTDISLELRSGFQEPRLEEGFFICRGTLEGTGRWSVVGEDKEAFRVSCKLGIIITAPEGALAELSEVDRRTYLYANATALAYGKIRAEIESITSGSVVGRQTLPAIDAYAYLKATHQA